MIHVLGNCSCCQPQLPPRSETATDNLVTHLRDNPEFDLADVAFTLHADCKAFPHRRAWVCRNREEAIAACASRQGVITSSEPVAERPVAFLFPGQGAQYVNMGRGLYDSERLFREEIDRCAEILNQSRGVDLREAIFSSAPPEHACQQMNQVAIAQPALFLIDYALAKLWISWGVHPAAMLGHSVGEYVAACLAGVFSLQDAVTLVADSGSVMQQAPRGAMLAVPLPSAEVADLVARSEARPGLGLAVVNGPLQSVVAGTDGDVSKLEAVLASRGVQCQRLPTSHAFHSPLMDGILTSYAERVGHVSLRPPTIPYLSNVSGTWIWPEEATDPDYWIRHLRNTVRFSDCLSALLANTDQVLLEVGPGGILSGLARQQPAKPAAVLQSLGRAGEGTHDLEVLLRTCGHLWTLGCNLDITGLYNGQRRRRVPLPTYLFERQRRWIEAETSTAAQTPISSGEDRCESRPAAPLNSRTMLTGASAGGLPNHVAASGRDQIEQGLKELFCECLGVSEVGPRDHFFELGGHSLLAVRLLTRIEKKFKKTIPLYDFFRSPTVESLGAILRGTAEPKRKEFSVIVPFNECGNGPPFYCVHSLGGEVASFRHLARILGPEQRFYGIQAPPESHTAEFASSIESMAQHYVDALTAFQPTGALLLGGWSAGSTIALEMAQQLKKSGRNVELLIALDGALFNTGAGTSLWNPVYYGKLLCNLPHWITDDLMVEFSFRVFARRVWDKLASLSRIATQSLIGNKKASEEVAGFMDVSFYSPKQVAFMKAVYDALVAYVPKPFDGAVLLYKARTQPLYHLFELDRAWSKVTSQVDVVTVRGTHVNIVQEPFVRPLAEDLRRRLSKYHTEGR